MEKEGAMSLDEQYVQVLAAHAAGVADALAVLRRVHEAGGQLLEMAVSESEGAALRSLCDARLVVGTFATFQDANGRHHQVKVYGFTPVGQQIWAVLGDGVATC